MFLQLTLILALILAGTTADAASRWSQSRMDAAQPMPMPLADITRAEAEELGQKAFTPDGSGVFSSTRVMEHGKLARKKNLPIRRIGRLFFSTPTGGDAWCSASVIEARLVLTAGHCVFDAVAGVFYTDHVFAPAYRMRPRYGRWTGTKLFTTPSWRSGGGGVPNAADFGIVVVRDKRGRTIASRTGKFELTEVPPILLHVDILGYPYNLDGGERLQKVGTQGLFLIEPNSVVYASNLAGGSSGGPYVHDFGERPVVSNGDDILTPYNLLVGAMSFGAIDESLRLGGTSLPGPEFTDMVARACADVAGNC